MKTRLFMGFLLLTLGISITFLGVNLFSHILSLERGSPPSDSPSHISSLHIGSGLSNFLAYRQNINPPSDRIKERDIKVYKDKVIIRIHNPQLARFTDTGSMKPTLGRDANAVEVVPLSPKDIHVGDIVSYYSNIAHAIIIHRVVEIGYDEKGWYAYLKGDNLKERDPEKVRFNQVKRVVVMLVY